MSVRALLWLAVLIFLGWSSCSWSAPVAEAHSAEYGTIRLHDQPGPCVRGALLAEWISADGKTMIPGCYVAGSGMVHIAFFDGDAVRVQLQSFRKPTGA